VVRTAPLANGHFLHKPEPGSHRRPRESSQIVGSANWMKTAARSAETLMCLKLNRTVDLNGGDLGNLSTNCFDFIAG
jgi:hypothetical protein